VRPNPDRAAPSESGAAKPKTPKPALCAVPKRPHLIPRRAGLVLVLRSAIRRADPLCLILLGNCYPRKGRAIWPPESPNSQALIPAAQATPGTTGTGCFRIDGPTVFAVCSTHG